MPTMSEDVGRFWATLFGGITAIGLVAGGFYSLVQYETSRAAAQTSLTIQSANAKLEAKKPFYQSQLELCTQASSDAAVLATDDSHSKDELAVAKADFYRLFYGPMILIEDADVKRSMQDFSTCLNGSCSTSLRSTAVGLSHACRNLIVQSWDVPLPDVFSRPKLPAGIN